jgi:DNA (cytosine-5)-methyltransferase 1
LKNQGWRIIRFWEHEVLENLHTCIQETFSALRRQRRSTANLRELIAAEEAAPYGKNGQRSFSKTSSVSSPIAPRKTFAEFFAGIGLMRMGLERQAWSALFANDIDPQKYEMYHAHFDDAQHRYLLDDIHKIPITRVPTVTLATASFPCNDLSLAGSRAGLRGKQSSAFWGFIRILNEMGRRKPLLVLLENVTGFLTSYKGMDFRDALLALNRLGYDVDAFIVDAIRFVPQSRNRLFVVAALNAQLPPFEARDTSRFYESDIRSKALADFIFGHPEIRWRIRELPSLPNRTVTLENIIEDIPETSDLWWNTERATYLLNQMSERHRQIANRMIIGPDWSYGTVFRRIRNDKSMAELRTDGIAGCLRTPRGGSGRQILFKAGKHRYAVRLLTPRECARLMGADDFKIRAPLNQALFGFGDAVCVPVIEWIAKNYLDPVLKELGRIYSWKVTAAQIHA